MDSGERAATLQAAVRCFDEGKYLAAHELFEELWEAAEGPESDFYKGLVQAAVCLHLFEAGNLDGAAKLHGGCRRYLAPFLPAHAGVDVARFLTDMQRALRPVLERRTGEAVRFPADRPRILAGNRVTPPG